MASTKTSRVSTEAGGATDRLPSAQRPPPSPPNGGTTSPPPLPPRRPVNGPASQKDAAESEDTFRENNEGTTSTGDEAADLELAKILSLQTFHEECQKKVPRHRRRLESNATERDEGAPHSQPPRPHSEPNILENSQGHSRIRREISCDSTSEAEAGVAHDARAFVSSERHQAALDVTRDVTLDATRDANRTSVSETRRPTKRKDGICLKRNCSHGAGDQPPQWRELSDTDRAFLAELARAEALSLETARWDEIRRQSLRTGTLAPPTGIHLHHHHHAHLHHAYLGPGHRTDLPSSGGTPSERALLNSLAVARNNTAHRHHRLNMHSLPRQPRSKMQNQMSGQADYCVYSLASHLAKTQLDTSKQGGGVAGNSSTLAPYPQTPPPPYSVTPPPPYSDTPPTSISPLPPRKSYAAALLTNAAYAPVGAEGGEGIDQGELTGVANVGGLTAYLQSPTIETPSFLLNSSFGPHSSTPGISTSRLTSGGSTLDLLHKVNELAASRREMAASRENSFTSGHQQSSAAKQNQSSSQVSQHLFQQQQHQQQLQQYHIQQHLQYRLQQHRHLSTPTPFVGPSVPPPVVAPIALPGNSLHLNSAAALIDTNSLTMPLAGATSASVSPSRVAGGGGQRTPTKDLIHLGTGHGVKFKQGRTDYETILANFDPLFQLPPELEDDEDEFSEDERTVAATSEEGAVGGAEPESVASPASSSSSAQSPAPVPDRETANSKDDETSTTPTDAPAAASVESPPTVDATSPHYSPPPRLPPRLYRDNKTAPPRPAPVPGGDEKKSDPAILGSGMNYKTQQTLDDDAGFTTFCRMVERVKTNVEISRLEAAVAVGGKETLASAASGLPIRGGMVVIASRMFLGEAFGHLSGIDTVNVVVELSEEILQPGVRLPPVAFPCDVSVSIDHIICNVLRQTQVMEAVVSLSTDFYLLKLHGRVEYLDSDSLLKEYEYVHHGVMVGGTVVPVKFVLVSRESAIQRSYYAIQGHVTDRPVSPATDASGHPTLQRGASLVNGGIDATVNNYEEIRDDLLKVRPRPKAVGLTEGNLEILMETLDREVSRLREMALSAPDGCHVVNKGVFQATHAICAMLGRTEILDISHALDRLKQTLSGQERFIKVLPDGTQVVSKLSKEESVDKLSDALDKLLEGIRKLLTLFCRRYSVPQLPEWILHSQAELNAITSHKRRASSSSPSSSGASSSSPAPSVSSSTPLPLLRPTAEFADAVILHVVSAHRIPIEWRQKFEFFQVRAGIYYGDRSLGPVAKSPARRITKLGFFERVVWDEWLQFGGLPLCRLPREARICLALWGAQFPLDAKGNPVATPQPAEGPVGDAVVANLANNISPQSFVPLGWVSLALFDHREYLVQGPQLLPLWMGEDAHVTGTLDTNVYDDRAILLQLNLPDFDAQLCFPSVIQRESWCDKMDYNALHPSTRMELAAILEKDPMTACTAEESELLWEKRHFLYMRAEALPRVLSAAPSWDWASLTDLYVLVQRWTPLLPPLQLLGPRFPDREVREMAVRWLSLMPDPELRLYLPQLVQCLRYEANDACALSEFLLEKSTSDMRTAHKLYWLLREVRDSGPHFRRRFTILLRALRSVVGHKLCSAFDHQEVLVSQLAQVASEVKSARSDANRIKSLENTLYDGMEGIYALLERTSLCMPFDPTIEVVGIDVKSCFVFNSNALPLRLAFNNLDSTADLSLAMFKSGDDLRQDAFVLQMVEVMNRIWLLSGQDYRIITFNVVTTGDRQGMVEIVPNCETLRKVQITQGLTGSFKDRPLDEWLRLHNPSDHEYASAVESFTRSCAGYCVATYVLGICDRHNDNIMICQSGHMFHIDFGKFLGDAQMFGNIKRDRVPFVLTSDMAYVINGGDKPSSRFQRFVDLCCEAFNTIRRHTGLLLTIMALMLDSGIPGLSPAALKYLQRALLPLLSDAEATAEFTRKMEESLKSRSTQINFFIHNLAQRGKFGAGGGAGEGSLLSFAPNTYSVKTDGRIRHLEILDCQKRYNPEKHYVYVLSIYREAVSASADGAMPHAHPDPSLIFRRYSEFTEFHDRLVQTFPLATLPALPGKFVIGRSQVKQVAVARRAELEVFLRELLKMAPEISECDLVYTFFHPLPRDQQEAERNRLHHYGDDGTMSSKSATLASLSTSTMSISNPSPVISLQSALVKGKVKLALYYKNDCLTVMVMHAKDLCRINDGGSTAPSDAALEPGVVGANLGAYPDPYVKTYLLPDPTKQTKRKTKIVHKTTHPTYNEMLIYRMPLIEVTRRLLQVTIWNYDLLKENQFMGAVYLRLSELDLARGVTAWYDLGPFRFTN